MDLDLYAFFGINIDCTLKEIKRAYRTKARQLHPDKNKENPKAKEEFQQLKEYYDILHNPVTKKEYDSKWRAKLEAAKRHETLDAERRKLKEKLEQQEEHARRERVIARKHSAEAAAADRIRREWQRQSEEEQEAQRRRKRAAEAQMADTANPSSIDHNTVVRVKWNTSENPEVAACYTQDFLVTCLSEYGDVVTVMMGKRGTAIADFRSYTEALKAVEASEEDQIGLPAVPLHLSFVYPQKTCASDSPPMETCTKQRRSEATYSKPPTNFDSFESDILSRMANFTG